jgi:EpsI family protein
VKRETMFCAVALLLLAAAGALALVPAPVTDYPLAEPATILPASLGGWHASNSSDAEILGADLNPPERFVRAYERGGDVVWVSLDYYPSQTENHRPAARGVLFPGRGWSTLEEQRLSLPIDGTSSHSIPANLVLMQTPSRRLAILYWYQLQSRSISSDHSYRAVLLYNRLFRRRTDGALVRIASIVPEGTDPRATVARQSEFVQAFYPELLRHLPR